MTAPRLAILLALSLGLAACATTPAGTPTAGLAHGQSGRFHVLIGPWSRIQEACRGIGAVGEGAILGCWLPAGDTHWIWVADGSTLADTLAHEVRHSHEGHWHP